MGNCHNGYLPLTEWWNEWCGDDRDNFESLGKVGVMHPNANAARWLAMGAPLRAGRVFLELYFDTLTIPTGGGIHLFSITSGHDAVGTPRGNPFYPGWLRFDFEVRVVGGIPYLQVGVYNADETGRAWYRRGNSLDIVIAELPLDVILTPQVWLPLEIKWDPFSASMVLSVNGSNYIVYPHPHSAPIAVLSVGNVDDFKGTIRFRNLAWGPIP